MMHDCREEVLRSKLTYALSLLTVVTDFMSSPSQCGTSLIVPIDWQCDCIGNSLGTGICPAVSLCPAEVGKSISVNLIAAHLLISFHHKPKANRLWKFSHLLAKRGGEGGIKKGKMWGVCWCLVMQFSVIPRHAFCLVACHHNRAVGVLWNCKMPHPSFKKLAHSPAVPESPVVILVRLQREQRAVHCPLELCNHLWVLPSSREEGREDTGVLPSSSLHSGATWSPSQPCSHPASYSAKQPAWFPQCWHWPAGTSNPSLPLPQLAGSLRVGLGSWRWLRGWQTSPRWPPCSEAGFVLASLLHHPFSYRAVVEGERFCWLCWGIFVRDMWEC